MSSPNAEGESPGGQYQSYLRQGAIHLQRCRACTGPVIFPPRTLCPRCGSTKLEWAPISGKGTVYSATVIHQRPERGGDYSIALVDLAEGARMLSSVRGMPAGDVAIGIAVRAIIESLDPASYIVRFEKEPATDEIS
ncbi:Zn-ribbon domain-containing OB-fold protein [Lichenicoccus sp.]|uniref:Zn-ribbon domain-containing OB-fold protein n=1 Tax=Lichenicoccus sp. TaxID=2781899 RepID=UPI003D1384AD